MEGQARGPISEQTLDRLAGQSGIRLQDVLRLGEDLFGPMR